MLDAWNFLKGGDLADKNNISFDEAQWMCRRGMLELDLLLERFLNKHFNRLTRNEKQSLVAFLQQDDTALYDLLVARVVTVDPKWQWIINKIFTNA